MSKYAGLLLGPMVIMSVADDAMHFLAIGDWGGSSDSSPVTSAEKQVVDGMASVASDLGGVRFVLAEGDNFYSSGIHGDEHSQRFIQGFEDVFSQPELQCPFYAIAGNHDHGGNVTAQVEFTHDSPSGRWKYPDFWYTFTESFKTSEGKTVSTQVVHIDTVTISGLSQDPEELGAEFDPEVFEYHHMQAKADAQMQWLEETLAASTADYLWIGGHYPVYSQCQHGPTGKIISDVLPLMKKYRVNGFVAGHDHCLGHYTEDNMAFVVSGAGKTCCYKPSNLNNAKNAGDLKFRMDKDQSHGAKGGFASFTVTEKETVIKYHDHTGSILYTADTVYPRSAPAPTPPAPTPPAPTPPVPTPVPGTWECHSNKKSGLGGDSDLEHTGDDVSTCQSSCEQSEGCVAINWHKTDNHCHIKTGTFGHDDFTKSFKSDSNWDSCYFVASGVMV